MIFHPNHGEYIMQAMKVENMVKLKEEFDYKSLCRRLETELDRLIAENERIMKAREDSEDECARRLDDAQQDVLEAESKLTEALEVGYTYLILRFVGYAKWGWYFSYFHCHSFTGLHLSSCLLA